MRGSAWPTYPLIGLEIREELEAIVDHRQWEPAEDQTALAAPAYPASQLVMRYHGPVRSS